MTTRQPLDEIRQLEAAGGRSLAEARHAAEARIQQAHVQAGEIVREAQETGRHEGQAQAQEAVARAEDQARILVAEAMIETEILQVNGRKCMQEAVDMAVAIVLGLEIEDG